MKMFKNEIRVHTVLIGVGPADDGRRRAAGGGHGERVLAVMSKFEVNCLWSNLTGPHL